MSFPVRDKVWQFEVNLQSYLDSDDAEATNKGLLLLIKNKLIGFALNPWIVESCSDSSAVGNNDQVDRWSDIGDIVHAIGNHSWIVLKDPITGIEFCFDANDSTQSMRDATLVWSPAVGFGASNGGTDGTIALRPIATDEFELRDTTQWGPGETGFEASVTHIWRSEDGECTRVAMMRDRSCRAYWDFSKAKDPISAWDPAVVCSVLRDTSSRLTYGVMNDNNTDAFGQNIWSFRHAAVGNGKFFIGTIGLLSSGVLENGGGRAGHAASPKFQHQMVPCILACNDATLQGLWGGMFDFYWGSTSVRTGEIILEGSEAWAMIDDIWLPWPPDLKCLVGS